MIRRLGGKIIVITRNPDELKIPSSERKASGEHFSNYAFLDCITKDDVIIENTGTIENLYSKIDILFS